MDEQIRQALANEVLYQLQDLNKLEPGSKEQQTAVENVTKLYKLELECMKAETDYDEKLKRREMEAQQKQDELDKQIREEQFRKEQEQNELDRQAREEQFKKDQLEEQVKDRYFRIGMEVAGIILPLMFYATWMKKGFKFEETGTFTSTTFRGLFNRFRPTKK